MIFLHELEAFIMFCHVRNELPIFWLFRPFCSGVLLSFWRVSIWDWLELFRRVLTVWIFMSKIHYWIPIMFEMALSCSFSLYHVFVYNYFAFLHFWRLAHNISLTVISFIYFLFAQSPISLKPDQYSDVDVSLLHMF